jgi:hypothetical protein
MAASSRTQALRDAWNGCDALESIHVHGYMSALPSTSDQIACRDSFTVGECHIDPQKQLRQRRVYWQTREDLLKPPAGGKRRTKRRRTGKSEWPPLVWTRGDGAQRKYGGANSLPEALCRYPRSKSIVLWTTSHWSDRLLLWWYLDAIDRAGLDLARFSVAEARSAYVSPDHRVPDPYPIACVPADRLRIAFELRVPLRSRYLATGARRWREYAASSPVAFDKTRRRGCVAFPELQASAGAHGSYFPRRAGNKARLRPSRLDEIFLDGFRAGAWLIPLEVLNVSQWAQAVRESAPYQGSLSQIDEWLGSNGKKLGFDGKLLRRMVEDRIRSRKRDEFRPLYDVLGGETFFAYRLQQGTRHQPDDPLLECRPGPNKVNSLMWVSYRLTARGQRMLEEGMLSTDDAPTIFAGGCEVYRPDSFWVRHESGDEWRLVQEN